MIILRQNNYSKFDLTSEENKLWEEDLKREGRPKISDIIKQSKRHSKYEMSGKERRDLGFDIYKDDDYYKRRINHGPQKYRWGKNAEYAINSVNDQHDDVVRSRIAKKKIGKNLTIGGAVIGGTALVGTGAYLLHRHNKKKKSKENKENKE